MAETAPQPEIPSVPDNQPKDISPATEPSEKAAEKPLAKWDGERIFLKGEIELFPDQRLPELDQRHLKAYQARGKDGENYYAVLCDRKLMPRISLAANYYSVINQNLTRLIASGVVDWLPERKQLYAFVFENHGGRKLTKLLDGVGLGWKAETAVALIIKPLAKVLDDMRNADFVHGAIRPDNIYIVGEGNSTRIVLGECLTLPFAHGTPAAYLPAHLAMAHPIARGLGSYDDDIYCLGATVAAILREVDPLAGIGAEEIVEYKIENGSYAALVGRERILGNVLEMLRGLLQDEPKLRWNLEEILAWIQGTRINPKQLGAGAKAKASRPIDFHMKKFMRPSLLALEVAMNPMAAAQLVASGDLKQWLSKSLQDQLVDKNVEDVMLYANESVGATNYAPKLALRLSIALYPELPIIYKGLRFYPDGFANAFAEAVVMERDLTPYAEMIQEQVVLYWINNANVSQLDVNSLIHNFDGARNALKHPMMGYGLERCLYQLAPDAPCLSPRFKDYYVRTPEDLFFTLNRIAQSGDRPEMPYDRHVAAFLSVRDRKVIDSYLADMASSERHRYVMAVIKSLSAIQTRAKLPEAPALSEWMADFIRPMISRFHDRELRVRLAEKLARVKSKGDLSKIIAVFEEANIVATDYRGFYMALRDYLRMKNEVFLLQHRLDTEKDYGIDVGRQYAAVISGAIALLLTIAYAALHFGSGFTIVG